MHHPRISNNAACRLAEDERIGNSMSTNESNLPKFAVGSRVRAKKGVVSSQYRDLSLGGWCGKVYEVSGTICFIHWSGATLAAVRTIHRDRWGWDGLDFRIMWFYGRICWRLIQGSRCSLSSGAALPEDSPTR